MSFPHARHRPEIFCCTWLWTDRWKTKQTDKANNPFCPLCAVWYCVNCNLVSSPIRKDFVLQSLAPFYQTLWIWWTYRICKMGSWQAISVCARRWIVISTTASEMKQTNEPQQNKTLDKFTTPERWNQDTIDQWPRTETAPWRIIRGLHKRKSWFLLRLFLGARAKIWCCRRLKIQIHIVGSPEWNANRERK